MKFKEVGLNRIKFENIEDFEQALSNHESFVEQMELRNFHELGFFVIEPPDDWNPCRDGLTSQKIREMDTKVGRPYYQKLPMALSCARFWM